MIKNFTRPLNIEELKEELEKYGKFSEFWMDKFRSMSLVFVIIVNLVSKQGRSRKSKTCYA